MKPMRCFANAAVPNYNAWGLNNNNYFMDRLLSSYLYELPAELIAQVPVVPRDQSRLLVVGEQKHEHRQFFEITDLLQPGDLLVFNNTKVIPARLHGYKLSGAKVEALLLSEQGHNAWLALVKPGRKLPIGTRLVFPAQTENLPDLVAEIIDRDEPTGGRILQFQVPSDRPLLEILDNYGQIPFPPYVTANTATVAQYQTVYAQAPGSVAAPTAGLHFTDELLAQLAARGIEQAQVTLHVGVGTFRPVTAENILEHRMHSEWLVVSETTVAKILAAKQRGHQVYAVGTTTVRSIETAAQSGELLPYRGQTDIFIYPGYQWRVVDGLITNFHLPGSSLLMLVSALIGRERLLDLYRIAIEESYRFYSFGDAMLVLPEAVMD
jgi:S-adenosylmethionine:tRNA ribosyltransferase-isomerase